MKNDQSSALPNQWSIFCKQMHIIYCYFKCTRIQIENKMQVGIPRRNFDKYVVFVEIFLLYPSHSMDLLLLN
jgi:hypothetical protein